MTATPLLPAQVAAAFDAMPPDLRACAMHMRQVIYTVARDEGVEGLEETLKWGQPAFVPGRRGTTVRLGFNEAAGTCSLLVHCQTNLVEQWRSKFGGQMRFEGNRAVILDPATEIDWALLSHCVADAFNYHKSRR